MNNEIKHTAKQENWVTIESTDGLMQQYMEISSINDLFMFLYNRISRFAACLRAQFWWYCFLQSLSLLTYDAYHKHNIWIAYHNIKADENNRNKIQQVPIKQLSFWGQVIATKNRFWNYNSKPATITQNSSTRVMMSILGHRCLHFPLNNF